MARVPVDVSSLRSMRQGTRVSARPVDTFTSIGNMVETNSKTQQIANALAQVQPSVARYFDQEFNQHKKDQENEGLKSYLEASPKEKAAFAKKIKSGEISEFESPFFIEGMSRGILRNKAREYGNSLIQDWNKNKMKNIPVNDFIAQHTSQFVKKNGLEVFDADVLNEEFYSRTASYNNQVNQRDFEHRIAKAKQDQLDILGEELVGHAQYAIGDNGQFLPETYVHRANETIQSYIDQGLDPKAALEQAIAQLKSIAVAENGENGEDIAWAIAHLKTRVGNYGDTGSGALWLENFKDEMEAMNLAAQDKALVREDKLKQKESEVDFEMAMQHLNEQGAEWFETDDGVEFMERIRTNQFFCEKAGVGVNIAAERVPSHVFHPTCERDVVGAGCDTAGQCGHRGHRPRTHAINRKAWDAQWKSCQDCGRSTQGEPLVALLGGGGYRNVIDALPGDCGVSL